MKMSDFSIVGSYDNQRISSISAERSVNLFEYNDPDGKKPKSLLSTPGIVDIGTVFQNTSGGFRAQFIFNNKMYMVVGSSVFYVQSNLISVLIGTIGSSAGYVGVDANNAEHPQLIFVDGSKGYIYDTTESTFIQITDSSFPVNPIDVCYLDGFFVVANGNTNTFQLSQLNQGLSWGPASNNFTTDFATHSTYFIIGASTIGGPPGSQNYQTGIQVQVSNSGGSLPTTNPQIVAGTTYFANFVDATNIQLATTYADAFTGPFITISNNGTPTNTIQSLGQLQQGAITSHPGNIVACRTLHRRLFLFSLNYTEVWENAGAGTNLPFRRNNALLMEYGTPSVGSISVGFDRMFFLSQDKDGLGSVMQVNGTESIPVSGKALDYQIAQYAANQGVSDSRGILIKQDGLIFYRLNFTASNHTFVYGVTTSEDGINKWHEEEILNGNRHPAQTHGYFNGINYYGDYQNPILYKVSPTLFTNNGEPIRRMRIGRSYAPSGYQRLRIDRFQLDLLQGSVFQLIPLDINYELTDQNGFIIETENGDNTLLEQINPAYVDPEEPVVFLSISKDSGQSFRYRVPAPMGATGQRTFRTIWRKLGTIQRGQAFVPKIEFYDEVPFIILGASWSYEEMPE